MQIWYLKIIVIVPILLLVLQGCMLRHFMDDHHSGMMGHGTKNHEGEKETGQQVGASQQTDLLDKRLRTDSQGGLRVEIQFKEVTEKRELAFAVRMSDHVVGINQYALDNLSTVANDQGTQVQAKKWQSIALSPQRVSGTLYFPGKDDSGKSLLAHGARNVTLRIKDMAGVSERIFQWNLTSSH